MSFEYPKQSTLFARRDETVLMKMVQMQEDALAYWRAKSHDCNDRIPARKDIKAQDLGRIMSHVIIVDVLSSPPDFRYRLVGTQLLEYLSDDYTGKCFSDFKGKGPDSKLWQLHEHVIKTRSPVFSNLPYKGPKSEFMRAATLFMPLAGDHQNIDMIMAVLNFETRIDLETKKVREDMFTILEL